MSRSRRTRCWRRRSPSSSTSCGRRRRSRRPSRAATSGSTAAGRSRTRGRCARSWGRGCWAASGARSRSRGSTSAPRRGRCSSRGASTLIYSTTNGTRAVLAAAAACETVFLGSLLNLSAVARAVQDDCVIVCAGFQGRFALDDAYCAGRIVDLLGGEVTDAAKASAILAAVLSDGVGRDHGENVRPAGARGRHRVLLAGEHDRRRPASRDGDGAPRSSLARLAQMST